MINTHNLQKAAEHVAEHVIAEQVSVASTCVTTTCLCLLLCRLQQL
jgi:hypothetical protein